MCRGEAIYIFGWSGLEDELELWRGSMVAFVADNEAVITNKVLNYRLPGLGVFAR